MVALVAAEAYYDIELERSTALLELLFDYVLGLWLMADAAVRGIRYGVGFAICFYGLLPVFLIYYGVRTRGKRGLRTLGLGALGFLLYGGLATVLEVLLST